MGVRGFQPGTKLNFSSGFPDCISDASPGGKKWRTRLGCAEAETDAATTGGRGRSARDASRDGRLRLLGGGDSGSSGARGWSRDGSSLLDKRDRISVKRSDKRPSTYAAGRAADRSIWLR